MVRVVDISQHETHDEYYFAHGISSLFLIFLFEVSGNSMTCVMSMSFFSDSPTDN